MLSNDINVSDVGDLIKNYDFTSSCDPHDMINDPMEVDSFIGWAYFNRKKISGLKITDVY